MAKAKKPQGWKAFDALTKKLVGVPKEEVEQKIASAPKRKARKKKGKK